MEKQGVIRPGLTRDVEDKLQGEKQASKGAKIKALDNDITKRAAETVATSLKK